MAASQPPNTANPPKPADDAPPDKVERSPATPLVFDMTPMIDVVFQLIIFFILTMTFTNKDIRPVRLPIALTAVPENPKDDILMMHLFNPGLGEADGDMLGNFDKWGVTITGRSDVITDVEALAEAIKSKVAEFDEYKDGTEISEMPVLVRGDMRAPSHFFLLIAEACIAAKVYKIQVSIAPDPSVLR